MGHFTCVSSEGVNSSTRKMRSLMCVVFLLLAMSMCLQAKPQPHFYGGVGFGGYGGYRRLGSPYYSGGYIGYPRRHYGALWDRDDYGFDNSNFYG